MSIEPFQAPTCCAPALPSYTPPFLLPRCSFSAPSYSVIALPYIQGICVSIIYPPSLGVGLPFSKRKWSRAALDGARGSKGEHGGAKREHGGAEGEHIEEMGVSGGAKRRGLSQPAVTYWHGFGETRYIQISISKMDATDMDTSPCIKTHCPATAPSPHRLFRRAACACTRLS